MAEAAAGAGYDARIASAFVALGYDLFPFAAFDGAGRVIVPGGVKYPEYVQAGLGRIAQAPIWTELYRTLSVLDNPQWGVFAAGIGFGPRTLNIAVFKSVSSVRDRGAAHQWTLSYQTTVARTLRRFAGTRHLVDPKWLSYLDEALDKLPAQEQADDPAEAWVRPAQSGGGAPPAAGANPEAVVPWLLLGLRFMSGLLQRFTPSTELRTTVFWFPTSGTPTLDRPFASRWWPIHGDYQHDGAIRAVHALWEPRAKLRFIKGQDVNWSHWLWAMPHELWQWCRAFYPTLNCGGAGQLLAGSPCVADLAAKDPVPSAEGLTPTVY